MNDILTQYGFSEKETVISPFGNGLINQTFLLQTGGERFILQKLNPAVFKSPWDIAFNIRLLARHLQQHHPDYLFVAPIQTLDGKDLAVSPEGYFRVFPFVTGSHSVDVVENAGQAFEAAKQFGRFTRNLSGLDLGQLKTTLPDFHNLTLRYQQFENALVNGNESRIRSSKDLVEFFRDHKTIVGEFEYCRENFKLRCVHHDTKISNVLFDDKGKGLCVIDLDTVMPGYFISDVGDMMRTYLSPVSEEEPDFSKIMIRRDIYQAIVRGYFSEMNEELKEGEKEYFLFAGKFMIYMQALRFLTDHLSNDIYYGARYEGQNFVRAGNQAVLLEKLMGFSAAENRVG